MIKIQLNQKQDQQLKEAQKQADDNTNMLNESSQDI